METPCIHTIVIHLISLSQAERVTTIVLKRVYRIILMETEPPPHYPIIKTLRWNRLNGNVVLDTVYFVIQKYLELNINTVV